ncbi:MAG: TolC family protein [Verrucomicrobiota bacterium]
MRNLDNNQMGFLLIFVMSCCMPYEIYAGYSWKDSVEMGLKHNAEIREAQQSIKEFMGQEMAAKSIFYPNGNLQALMFPPTNLNVSLNQGIFEPGAVPQVERAQAAVKAAEANVQLEILEFVIRSRVAFLEILFRERQIELQREFANKIKVQLNILPSLFEGGLVQKSDIKTMEVRYSLALTSVEEATWAWKQAIVDFADIIGSPKAKALLEKGVAGVLEPRFISLPSLEQLEQIAYENRHDLKVLDALLKTESKAAIVAAAGYYPTWSAYGSVDFNTELQNELEALNSFRNVDDDDSQKTSARIGTRLSWRLFDGFETTGRKKAANAIMLGVEELHKSIKRNISGEVAQAVRQYQDARKIYELLQTGIVEENSEQVKQAFLRNRITQVEVFISEEESFQAKRNELLALYNMELARVNLYAATGQLVKVIENKD